MLKFTAKRLVELVLTLICVSFLVFSMVRLLPGDPINVLYGFSEGGGSSQEVIEQKREELGLNRPYLAQYANWIRGVLQGDLGTSLFTHKPIAVEISNRYFPTLMLAIGGTVVGSVIGIILGVLAAVRHNRLTDSLVMLFSMFAVSTPSFFMAMILMLVFTLQLGWLPSIGLKGPLHYVLPILTLGILSIGTIARTTRSSMLDVINQDYIRTSKARGVAKGKIYLVHALKNALIPVLTTIGLRFGSLLLGASVVEVVFNIQGLGRYMVDSISKRDYLAIQSSMLLFATVFVVVNTIVDLLYALADPRVKYE